MQVYFVDGSLPFEVVDRNFELYVVILSFELFVLCDLYIFEFLIGCLVLQGESFELAVNSR